MGFRYVDFETSKPKPVPDLFPILLFPVSVFCPFFPSSDPLTCYAPLQIELLFGLLSCHQPVSLVLTIFLTNAVSSYPPACCVFVCVSVQLSLFPEFTGRVNNIQSVPFSIKVTNKWNTGVVLDNTSSTT